MDRRVPAVGGVDEAHGGGHLVHACSAGAAVAHLPEAVSEFRITTASVIETLWIQLNTSGNDPLNAIGVRIEGIDAKTHGQLT